MLNQHYSNSLTPELYCSNLKISLSFYIDLLGFNIQYQRANENFAMIERQGSRLMLEEINHNLRTWISGPMEYPFGRGINLEINTDNIETLYRLVQDANASIFLPIEDKW